MCMCMLNKRTHILFDQSMWQMLTNLSIAKRESVGKIVRDAVKTVYMKTDELETRRKAIESILKNRPAPAKGKIDYKALINYGRRF